MSDYAKRVASLRDEDLMEIAFSNEHDGFDPVFVAVARKEMSRRKIDESTQEHGAELQRQKEISAALDAVRSQIPLKRAGALMFLFFSVFIVPSLIAASVLLFRGYNRKARDALTFISIGFALWAVVFIIANTLI